MIDRIKKYMERYHMLKSGDSVVMGISGGADSVAMLLAFCSLREEYGLSLYGVHVDHGIRREAGEDADFVKALCETKEIPFYLFREDVKKMAADQKKTVEEMGREIRYRCFGQVMEKVGAEVLATAHHRGDQAETVLFHMIRGTDLSGMAGIRPVDVRTGESGSFRVVRPLLCCKKEELKEWLVSQGALWREDVTNQDNTYTRNRLRNEILPELEQVHSGALDHIADLAGIMWEYEQYFDKKAADYMEMHVRKYGENGWVTDRGLLKSQETVLARMVICEMLKIASGGEKKITRRHIEAVYELLGGQSGKKVVLPDDVEAVISYENLLVRRCLNSPVFGKNGIETSKVWERQIDLNRLKNGEEMMIPLPFGGRLLLACQFLDFTPKERWDELLNDVRNSKNNYTKFFDCDTIKDMLCIRMAKQGDYFIMNEEGQRKKLSRYMIDCHISRDKRREMLVLACGNEVLYVLGGRRCESFQIGKDTKNILKVTYEGE